MAVAGAMAIPPPIPVHDRLNPSLRGNPSIPFHYKTYSNDNIRGCWYAFRAMRKTPGRRRPSFFFLSIPRAQKGETNEEEAKEVEPDFSVLTSIRSQYNDIIVVDTPQSRLLLLDSTHNIHSIMNKAQKFTGSYWDEFASLPALVPKGPIAILGLGGGTAAQLMLDLWPSLHIEGWEIDGVLIEKAKEYFGLSDLENATEAGGFLSINIGDALSPSAVIPGGYAGIVVDLFSDGKVLPQLQEVTTWLELGKRLMPLGRIMVNCGGAHAESSSTVGGQVNQVSLSDSFWIQNSTIRALLKAFPGNLSWKRMAEKDSDNYLALTGSVPDLDSWSSAVPGQLSLNVKDWKPCELA